MLLLNWVAMYPTENPTPCWEGACEAWKWGTSSSLCHRCGCLTQKVACQRSHGKITVHRLIITNTCIDLPSLCVVLFYVIGLFHCHNYFTLLWASFMVVKSEVQNGQGTSLITKPPLTTLFKIAYSCLSLLPPSLIPDSSYRVLYCSLFPWLITFQISIYFSYLACQLLIVSLPVLEGELHETFVLFASASQAPTLVSGTWWNAQYIVF